MSLLLLCSLTQCFRHKSKLRNKSKLSLRDDDKKECKGPKDEPDVEKLSAFSTLS
jgi:hypothetical protein